jgi:hypothetical protein
MTAPQGLPGSIDAVPMPWATIQDNRALDTNSGVVAAQEGRRTPCASQENETGYWESSDLVAIHDQILSSAGSNLARLARI